MVGVMVGVMVTVGVRVGVRVPVGVTTLQCARVHTCAPMASNPYFTSACAVPHPSVLTVAVMVTVEVAGMATGERV